jgi:hypothetical protein
MTLTSLLETFKVKVVPDQRKSSLTKKTPGGSDLDYTMLLNMSVKDQIICILQSPRLQNAFIDLIKTKKIPQAIIDHQERTVLPFDGDCRYPCGKNERYTIIMNMKYIFENELITKHEITPVSSFYTTEFNDLLKKYAYYKYNTNRISISNNKTKLISIIINYIMHRMWSEKHEGLLADNVHKLKNDCRELFYSDLDKDIEEYFSDYVSDFDTVSEDMEEPSINYFHDYLTKLGLTSVRYEMRLGIRKIVRQDIDNKIDALVEKLKKYTYADVFAFGKKFEVNLLTNHSSLFEHTTQHNVSPKKYASLYYYFQNEKYVDSDICHVDISSPFPTRPTVNINKLNGSFPNITALPSEFGTELSLHIESELKLPDFPNLTTIGDDVLHGLRAKSIEFGKMNKLTTIRDNFCKSVHVENIDLQGLKKVKTIGSCFLCNINVRKIDMPPLPLLKDIGPDFLEYAIIKDKNSKLETLMKL